MNKENGKMHRISNRKWQNQDSNLEVSESKAQVHLYKQLYGALLSTFSALSLNPLVITWDESSETDFRLRLPQDSFLHMKKPRLRKFTIDLPEAQSFAQYHMVPIPSKTLVTCL